MGDSEDAPHCNLKSNDFVENMFEEILKNVNALPKDTKQAVLILIDILTVHLSPKLLDLRNKLCEEKDESFHKYKKEYDLFTICNSQISKSTNFMVEVFKKEIVNSCILSESRSIAIERIVWCLEKLNELHIQISRKDSFCVKTVNSNLTVSSDMNKKSLHRVNNKTIKDFEICAGDDFISWVDDALDLMDTFSRLFEDKKCSSDRKHKNDSKEQGVWKDECSSGLLSLHGVVRELVFAAMSICQNCLHQDQKIINARCHVVLRESKNFISEIMVETKFSIDDCDSSNLRKIVLKKNIHYPTVKLFIDILKDAIYNLEACINRAVLGLVLTCLVDPAQPLQSLLDEKPNDILTNVENVKESILSVDAEHAVLSEEDTTLVKGFDIHNERLVQIGLFAISCSADRKRVSMLKSCLASLEALDPYLVPTVLSTPESPHAQVLVEHWIKEIFSLRTLVFLIVDPVAYIELVVEQYQSKLSVLRRENNLHWFSAQYLIGLGQNVLDYVKAYTYNEPKAFQHLDKILPIISDVKKVVKECKAASDLFLSKTVKGDIQQINEGNECLLSEQELKVKRVMKRLKLLYTLISRISREMSEEKTDSSFDISMSVDSENNRDAVDADLTKTIEQNENEFEPKKKGILKILEKFKLGVKSEPPIENKASNDEIKEISKFNTTLSRSTFARIIPKTRRIVSSTYICPSPIQPTRQLEIPSSNVNHRPVHNLFSASDYCLDQNHEEFILANISTQAPLNLEMEELNLSEFKFGSPISSGQNSLKKRSLFYGEQTKNSRRRRASLRRRLLLNRTDAKKNNVPSPIGSPRKNQRKPKLCMSPKFSSSFNTSLDLQITDILEQLTGLSDTMSLIKMDTYKDDKDSISNKVCPPPTSTTSINDVTNVKNNILTLKINDDDHTSLQKNVWNIRVTTDKENIPRTPETGKDTSKSKKHESPAAECIDCEIDVSFGSNIPTPERLNDLNLLEQKISDLRQFWKS